MAYFDTTSPAGVLNREITATRSFLSVTRSFLSAIGGFFTRMIYAMAENSSMNARVLKVRQLEAKTDEELAALKIKREDIVRHVFADLYYL